MSGIHTSTVQSVHAYTRADVPWELAGPGVMRAHGRDVRQMERARRRRRFVVFVVAFWTAWAILYFS